MNLPFSFSVQLQLWTFKTLFRIPKPVTAIPTRLSNSNNNNEHFSFRKDNRFALDLCVLAAWKSNNNKLIFVRSVCEKPRKIVARRGAITDRSSPLNPPLRTERDISKRQPNPRPVKTPSLIHKTKYYLVSLLLCRIYWIWVEYMIYTLSSSVLSSLLSWFDETRTNKTTTGLPPTTTESIHVDWLLYDDDKTQWWKCVCLILLAKVCLPKPWKKENSRTFSRRRHVFLSNAAAAHINSSITPQMRSCLSRLLPFHCHWPPTLPNRDLTGLFLALFRRQTANFRYHQSVCEK